MTLRKPFRAVPITLGKRARAAARRKRLKALVLPIAVLAGAAGIGGVAGVLSTPSASSAAKGPLEYVRIAPSLTATLSDAVTSKYACSASTRPSCPARTLNGHLSDTPERAGCAPRIIRTQAGYA
jgi:hypothetical protein